MLSAAFAIALGLSSQAPLNVGDSTAVVLKADLAEYLSTTARTLAKERSADYLKDVQSRLAVAKRARIDRRLTRPDFGGKTEGNPPRYTGFRFPSEKEKREYVAGLTKELTSARNYEAKALPPPLPAHRLAVGAVGRLYCVMPPGSPETAASTMKVVAVVNDGLCVMEMGRSPGPTTNFLLHVATNSLVDGAALRASEECYEVTGTTMVRGETMFEIKPLDLHEFVKGGK